jgi:hypothetical protein
VPGICARLRELLRQPGLTERQCYYYLQSGYWPGVNNGGRWQLRPHRVLEEMRKAEDRALAEAAQRRAARLAAAKAGNGEHHPEEPRAKRPERSPAKRARGEGRSRAAATRAKSLQP